MSAPQPHPDTSSASPARESVPSSPPPNAPLSESAQTVLTLLDQASTAREQLNSAREHMSHAREHLSDPSMPATILGAAHNVISRFASSSAQPHHHHHHHSQGASTSGAQPLPELPRDQPAEAGPASPADALAPARAAETTVPAPTSISSHGGRAVTPPTRSSRTTGTRSSYPLPPEAAHSRPIPGPFGTAYRRPAGLHTDSETIWNASDGRDPRRERTVGERIEATITSAQKEKDKSSDIAYKTNLYMNIALTLQVLIGALTTALGAALSGKNTSVAISILGGASTLVASYLARTKGSNEPQLSRHRAQALEHFLREIRAFDVDYGHKTGTEWDDKISGFRLGLEKILGNQPGSVAINPDGTFNAGQEKGMGGIDPNQGFSGNGYGKSYPTGAMKV